MPSKKGNIQQLLHNMVLLLLLAGLSSTSVSAFDLVTLNPDKEHVGLGDRLSYLEDREAIWSFEDVRSGKASSQWQRSQLKIPAFGYTSSAYWFAVDLKNSNSLEIERLLEISYPLLDSVDIFLDRSGGLVDRVHTGDRKPFAQRPIEHRHFLFPIRMSGNEALTLYMRVKTSSALQVPATLWSERAFWLADQRKLIIQALYFGVMLVMILYNLFIYATVRDSSYVFYVLFVSCFTIVQLVVHGFSFHYFWPEQPGFNEKILVFCVSIALIFAGFFANSLLDLKSQNIVFYRLIILSVLVAGANAMASLIVPYAIVITISLGLILVLCSLSLAAGAMMWQRGYTPARYYTVAWMALLVGAVVFVFNKTGIIPRTLFTENAMQIGSIIEVILLSFALANRINVAHREKAIAQAESVAILQKYRTLYQNAVEGIFRTTLQYDFVSANLAMAGMLDLDYEEESIPQGLFNLRQCYQDEQEADDFFHRLADQHEIIGHEFRGRTLKGADFWASLSLRTVYGEDDQPRYYEGSMVDITKRRRAEEQVRYLAYYDNVTGLPNRTLLHEHIKSALDRAKRNNEPVAVLFVDLNRFKLVNDTLGHDVGDQLLRDVALRLNTCLRGDDWVGRPQSLEASGCFGEGGGHTVARLGGDEFVMVLSDIREAEDAAVVARRVGNVLAQSFLLEEKEVYVSASIGISTYPNDGENPAILLKRADMAMYHAKKLGSNGYQFFTDAINEHASRRLTLETDLRNGLDREQFQLHYQPKACVKTGRIIGMEALCRWHHPVRGMVFPIEFISLAEESGLIVPLGEKLLRMACAQNKAWQDSGYPPIRVSVNLSARQFKDPEFPEAVSRVLSETALDPAYLELELTESILMDDTEETGKTVKILKEMGLYIAIDDFGTGYSSLSYLKRFSVDILKIDRCFIHNITEDKDNQAITSAIISLAQTLALKVIAEGVETEEQLEYLRARHCDEIQGYWVSEPVSADEFTRLLQRTNLLDNRKAVG